MKTLKLFFMFTILALYSTDRASAQGTAVPFLLITSSPEGNGMGGIGGSIQTDNAMSTLANPGQLGMMTLDHFLIAGTYTENTAWLPEFELSGLTYNTYAINEGVNFQQFSKLPFGLSVGYGYSKIMLNLGTFTAITEEGGPIYTWEAKERSENFDFGIGFEYVVKIGLGYSVKYVDSDLTPWNEAKFSTYDLGMIMTIPVFGIISKFREQPITFGNDIEPMFDITFGYAKKNLGDKFVIYTNVINQGDPLPRTALMGLSWKAGIIAHASTQKWEVISFTLAREAEDVLVKQFPAPTDSLGNPIGYPPPSQYVDGSGDIQFFRNVIAGEWGGKIWLRKGWQTNIGEFFYMSGGRTDAPGLGFSTLGYAFRLAGILKTIEALNCPVSDSPVFKFFVNHVDLRFDHSQEYNTDGAREGTTYDGLNFVLN